MSIFVCGDIHSTLDINKLDHFIGREDLDENDYLIICGDTGICGFSKEQESATREYLRKLPMPSLMRYTSQIIISQLIVHLGMVGRSDALG